MADTGWRRNKYGGWFNINDIKDKPTTNDYMNDKIRSQSKKGKEYKIPKDIIQQTYERRGYPNNDKFADFYLASIDPDDFLKLTTSSSIYSNIFEENEMWGRKLDINKVNESYMFLEVDMKTGKVTSHEGRHRMAMLKENGYKKAEIIVFPAYGTTDRYNPETYYNKSLSNQTGNEFKTKLNKITPLTRGEIERLTKGENK